LPADRELAAAAGAHLGAAGLNAWKRSDAPAAVNLLARATALLPEEDPFRLELLCELGVALRAAGETDRAEKTLEHAIEASTATGNERVEVRARLELAYARLLHDPEGRAEELLDLASHAIPVLEALGDDRALGRAWLFVGLVHGGFHGRHASWQEAAERALVHHRRAHFPTSYCLGHLAAALYYGPTPVPQALRRCKELLRNETTDRVGEANVLVFLGGLEAMRGRLDEARGLVMRASAAYDELGQTALAATYGWAVLGDIDLLAGNFRSAERSLTELCRLHEQMHSWGPLSTRAADLAEALYALGRYDDAERWSRTAEAHAGSDDLSVQPLWRAVRAKVLARRGMFAEAEALAREAAQLAESTDALNLNGKVLLDLAEVLRLAGRADESASTAAKAARLYERKGNVVAGRRARALVRDPAPA
jgi:tetratricopeptide (TPR) repeat protein